MSSLIQHLVLFANVAGIPAGLVGGVISKCVKASWRRTLKVAFGAFIAAVLLCYVFFRASAREAFTQVSPDGRFKVVCYRLPNFSMMPGSGSDGPAYADVYKANGEKLGHVELEMLQCAEVSWDNDYVNVGEAWIGLK